jgi:hypothetical protein
MKIILNGIKSWFLQPFSWTEWTDISTFAFACDGYLLQGKRNTVSNAKKFRITILKQAMKMANAPVVPFEKLVDLGVCIK